MEKRKCKICGQQKTEAEFSKSYRGQCKQCVARKSREKRASSKTAQEGNTEYFNIPGTILDDQPNWEQRRYEIAKDMMAAFLSNSCSNVYAGSMERQAHDAVEYADVLIAELKKSEKKGVNE